MTRVSAPHLVVGEVLLLLALRGASTLGMQAAAGTDLLVFGLGGVPTVRRSHTIGAGRAPMRQVRANSLGRGAFAQEVDASAWLSSLRE